MIAFNMRSYFKNFYMCLFINLLFVVCYRNGFISVKTLYLNMLETSLRFPPEEHYSLVSAPKGFLDRHTEFILQ